MMIQTGKKFADFQKFHEKKVKELTGRPTAILSKETLLTPALSFTLPLKASLGFSNCPYTVPETRSGNSVML